MTSGPKQVFTISILGQTGHVDCQLPNIFLVFETVKPKLGPALIGEHLMHFRNFPVYLLCYKRSFFGLNIEVQSRILHL